MNRPRLRSQRPAPRDVWERLSQRLEEVAERECHYSNAAILRRLRDAYFADVDALAKSGTVKIPK